jgi:hypothetical protein
MLSLTGASMADIPNLVGNWTGSFEGYEKSIGYMNSDETGALTMVISEQKGRLFTGNFSFNFSLNETGQGQRDEGFSGIIGLDNKTLYISEYDRGYDIGTITSNDTIELAYLEDGETGKTAGAFIDKYQRLR